MKTNKFWGILVMLFTFITANVYAQDIMVKRDGTVIKSKVLKVSDSEIEYKKSENIEGPTYVIDKIEIISIQYENGTTDNFATATQPQQVVAEKQEESKSLAPSSNQSQGTASTDKSLDDTSSWTDFTIHVNTDNKIYGYTLGSTFADFGYYNISMSMGLDDYSSYNYNVGVGVSGTYSNKFLMIQAVLYPYAGYCSYQVPEYNSKGYSKKKDKSEFAYGAAASARVGFKLFESKKGSRHFLTLGYYMSAPKFETENMIDNGSWCLGWSVNINN